MIEVYSWPTPNGHKVHIMLEECGQRLGRDWTAHPINISNNAQFNPEFLKISPNNKIPALIDPNGPDGKPISLFESGAILIYLASKFNQFLPSTDRGKFEVLQWLMFQMGGVGPMLGQAHHFRNFAPEKIDYGINRFTSEAKRLYAVMDRQISQHPYIADDEYSIADIAIFPWLRSWENQGIDWKDYPHLKAWFNRVSVRPAVARGVQTLAHQRRA